MDGEDMYFTVGTVKDKYSPLLSPEKLSRMWDICLKTAINNLDSTTHQCIRSTGIIEKRFKTDKAQIQYKKLSCWYVKFYVDYIKVGVK